VSRSTRKRKKPKGGRPKTTGVGTPMMVRMHTAQLQAIDRWIRDTGISRPEAIRQLVNWALGIDAKLGTAPTNE
jgi:hypothetical protein